MRMCSNISLINATNTIKPMFPVCSERIKLNIERDPDVDFAVIFHEVQPMFSIAMTLFNAQNLVTKSLRSISNYTTSTWSIDLLIDACTDNTRHTLADLLPRLISRLHRHSIENCIKLCSNKTNACSHLGFPTRIRVITADTPVWETRSENIIFRNNAPSLAYISVQSDQQVLELGWNIELSLPIQLWHDVISVSANCAHNIFKYKGMTDFKNIGMKCTSSSISYNLSHILHMRTQRHKRLTFHVRQSSNRGPLLLHALKMQTLKFFDERNFILSNDDHDLHLRAYGFHRYVTGYWPIAWKDVLSDKLSDRQIKHGKHTEALNISDTVMSAFIRNRDGGYAGWSYKGQKPRFRAKNAPKVNTTKNIHHTRYTSVEKVQQIFTACDEYLYEQMRKRCSC